MTLPRPGFPCQGSCACGAVRYRLLEEPLGLHVCHCTTCQRITGSAFVLSMPVRRAAIEVERGQPVLVGVEVADGPDKHDRRCPDCGSRLWSEPPKQPEVFTLRPGTLDDTSWLHPVGHIWTASAQPWVPIPEPSETLLVYPHEPDDGALVRAWQRYRKGPGSAGRAG